MRSVKIRSDIAGVVAQVVVQPGAQVGEDETLVLIESMKMEIPVVAPTAGRVVEVSVSAGDTVAEGDVLVLLAS